MREYEKRVASHVLLSGVVWIVKHLEGALQSLSPILLSSFQSEGEAMEDPCRPSNAAPTHLVSEGYFDGYFDTLLGNLMGTFNGLQ